MPVEAHEPDAQRNAVAAGEYRSKYDAHIARIGMTPATFARRYSVPLHSRLTRLSGH
jgi:hypothetical protein